MRLPLGLPPRTKAFLFYAAMVGAAVGAFYAIRAAGVALSAPPPAGGPGFGHGGQAESGSVLTHVLLALVVIILCARGLGSLFKRFHQPPVIGEMIAGILLGPSLLGRALPGVSSFLLPSTVAPYLAVISDVGVILYMFLVGVELNTKLVRQQTHSSVAISHASIIAPFLLGSGLALWLYPSFATSDVPFVAFALFMGLSMSVTAFPVLARIITDRHMQGSRLGAISLVCAAVDDVTAWCLFALVVSVAKAQPGHALLTVALTAGFILAVLVFVRPAAIRFARLHDLRPEAGQTSIVIACAALLLAALTTQQIGIHALFGAFLVGTLIPHDSNLAREIKLKFEDLVVGLFLPAFFAFTGLRTQIGLLQGARDWIVCLAVIAVASLGKFGGGALAARLTGLDWGRAASLGILMNTRGLMELIVLNVGMDLGVLSAKLFAMLVIMAVVTTLATTPVLDLLSRRSETFAEAPNSPAPAGVP